jgi:HK97 gp10 family phage protein
MPGVDTGALINSLQTELLPGEVKGIYSTNMEYAEFLEAGTTRMLARPFMTPAAERNRGKFMSKMKQLEDRLE